MFSLTVFFNTVSETYLLRDGLIMSLWDKSEQMKGADM